MWIISPLIYLIAAFWLCMFKNELVNVIPNIMPKFTSASVYKVKIPVSSPEKIMAITRTYDKYNDLPHAPTKKTTEFISSMSMHFNYNFTSIDQINEAVLELATTTDTSSGLISRFWRFVTFVNFVWLISICGMVVTFYPMLFQIFGPIMVIAAERVLKVIMVGIRYKVELGFGFLTIMLTQSIHCHKDVGFYIALTSLAGYCAFFLHCVKTQSSSAISIDILNLMVHSMLVIPTIALTFLFESDLLGFCSVGILYSFLGFSSISSGLCWAIGFDSREKMNTCIGASLILLPLYFVMSKTISLTKYFYYGVYVFGVIVYLLGMLISASRFVSSYEKFVLRQIMMIVSVIIIMWVSTYFNIAALYNVGATFACLYFSDKIGESSIWKGSEVVLVFLCFLLCYLTSLWLNMHPQFLMDIIKG